MEICWVTGAREPATGQRERCAVACGQPRCRGRVGPISISRERPLAWIPLPRWPPLLGRPGQCLLPAPSPAVQGGCAARTHVRAHVLHAHTLTCTHRHIFCQARRPPQSWVPAGPSPGRGLGPQGQPLPRFWPSRLGRGLTRSGPPSWLTNLETLNRGNTVLEPSLPPRAGALGEGQERRKVVNERQTGPGSRRGGAGLSGQGQRPWRDRGQS